MEMISNNKNETHHGFRSGSLSLPGIAENLFIEEEIEDRKHKRKSTLVRSNEFSAVIKKHKSKTEIKRK